MNAEQNNFNAVETSSNLRNIRVENNYVESQIIKIINY